MVNIFNIGRKRINNSLLALVMLSFTVGYATNEPNKVLISGQVLHVQYGGPIANHLVTVSYANGGVERTNYYTNEVYTNQDGYYYDTIKTDNKSGEVIISTFDKDQKPYEQVHHFRFIDNLFSNILLSNFFVDAPYQFKPLQARFKYVQKAYGDRFRFSFFDQTTNPNIVSRVWDFGDGTQSDLRNPEHQYSTSGLYKVSLTVTAQNFSHHFSNTITQLIYISAADFYHLGGHVFSDYMPIDLGCAFLYSIDSLNVLKAVDTAHIDTLGYYYFYQMPAGDYIVKSELSPNSALIHGFLPTYFGDFLYWQQAQHIHLNHTSWEYDIHLKSSDEVFMGNGMIEGKIEYDNLPRGMGLSKPASGVNVYLIDDEDNILTCRKSNIEGVFDFENIEAKTYWIYPEITGVTAEKIEVVLSFDDPHVGGIHITIVDDVAIGIHDQDGILSQDIQLYPNPVSDRLIVQFTDLKQKNIAIELCNSMGQVVYASASPELLMEKMQIDVSKFPSGIYVLKLIQNGKAQSWKILVNK